MRYWKEHENLRTLLIALFFIVGMALVTVGWKMSGKLAGLGLMLAGLVFLLAAIMVYNQKYQ